MAINFHAISIFAPGGPPTHQSTLPRCLIPAPAPVTFYGIFMRLSLNLNLPSIEMFGMPKSTSADCKVHPPQSWLKLTDWRFSVFAPFSDEWRERYDVFA